MAQQHRPVLRPGRVRVLAAVAGALAGALVGATLAVVAPAQARLAIPVDCSQDKVVLEWDHTSYDLEGSCGVVVVAADDTHVSMPTATRLVVRGQGNEVTAKPVTELEVLGHHNAVTTPSVRTMRLASPGSRVAVEGLVEVARLGRGDGVLRARQVTRLVVRGHGHDVRARRGYDTRLHADRSAVAFRRLDDLRVTGDHNRVSVRRGATRVRDAGEGNRVTVRRRR